MNSIWITVGDADINVIKTDEGVVVDVWSTHDQRQGSPLVSTWALDSELGPVLADSSA